jgi:hypothetical protein
VGNLNEEVFPPLPALPIYSVHLVLGFVEMINYLFKDCESGGIDPRETSLLTGFFAVTDDCFNIQATLDLAIKYPVYKVCSKALEVNKIDLVQHEANAVTVAEAENALNQFLKPFAQKVRPDLGRPVMNEDDLITTPLIPVGHNVGFDVEFCKVSLPGVKWSKYVSYRVLDTQVIGRFLQLQGKLPADLSISLRSLAQYFDIKDEAAHTAEGDVLVTIDVFKHLLAVM